MLTRLLIRDFAIIEELELDLRAGMTALTGETGAGKSILVDAIGLVLGDRADSGVVRAGSERAEVVATFDLADAPECAAWLAERDLENNDGCMIRRVISQDGRSRAYLNGSPATLTMLRELGEQLVNIHGQHAHQALGRADYQRDIVDLQADHADALDALAECYREWHGLHKQLEGLEASDDQRQERLEFLRFQVQELEAAAPTTGEYEELAEQHARLAHAGQLTEKVHRARALLFDGEPDARTLLTQALDALEEAGRHDPGLMETVCLLRNAQIEIDEADPPLRHYLDELQIDPDQIESVDSRIALLQSLARKHRCNPDELPERLARLVGELDGLAHADERRAGVATQLKNIETSWRADAKTIGAARERSARQLEETVTEAMQSLGMEGGRFTVAVEHRPDSRPSLHGLDRVEFWISTNPGQPAQILSKVASGGELSRISLAIQLAATRDRRIPTLIFDEVDSGIGGSVAEVVGRMLRALGRRHQVLCVTHLAQVAAQADQHIAVNKTKESAATRTGVVELEEPARRIEELARMLGGIRLTEQTRAHAEEMLRIAQSEA